MNRERIDQAIDNVSVAIDILQATTDYYREMESSTANDLIKLNDIVHLALRDSVNEIIQVLKDIRKD